MIFFAKLWTRNELLRIFGWNSRSFYVEFVKLEHAYFALWRDSFGRCHCIMQQSGRSCLVNTMVRDVKEAELGKNEPNQNPGFAKNRTEPHPAKYRTEPEPNCHRSYSVLSLNELSVHSHISQ